MSKAKPMRAWLRYYKEWIDRILISEPYQTENTVVVAGVFVPQEVIDHIKGWLLDSDALPETHQWDKGFNKAVAEALKLIEPEAK